MRSAAIRALLFGLLVSYVLSDCYLHNPRGSNNRLNETGTNRDNNNRMCDTQNNAKGGYCINPEEGEPMHFYVGSLLTIEWTSQHGCGGNGNVHCNVVIQYMCGSDVRDGTTTQTIPDNKDEYNKKDENGTYIYGMHEDYQYYQDCKTRERNKGLFIADQDLNNRESATHTRQNNNGNRNGFECPEERDYYPYWHPTPWKDIAVLVDPADTDRCDFYKSESQNVKEKNYCDNPRFNNEKSCSAGGGKWKKKDPWDLPAPACLALDWSRDNHLGNPAGSGVTASYNWTVFDDPGKWCVLRIRYNISSGDYDGWDTFSEKNGAASPVTDDPYVKFGDKNLSLAIDTSQFGRTFQDRSHVFEIRKRPSDIGPLARIWNLNVRGKRGNIVQTYPATEYDFVPNHLQVRPGDYIHFQWTGCDKNPQGNDGEGTRGTDRSNLVEMKGLDKNYPVSLGDQTFFDSEDEAYKFAHLNQKGCKSLKELLEENNNNQDDVDRDPENCMKLNAASPYFNGGLVPVNKTGNFYFMSSRNNNFTNRSQKVTIESVPFLPVWGVVVVVFGGAVFLGSVGTLGAMIYAKSHPQSAVAGFFNRM